MLRLEKQKMTRTAWFTRSDERVADGKISPSSWWVTSRHERCHAARAVFAALLSTQYYRSPRHAVVWTTGCRGLQSSPVPAKLDAKTLNEKPRDDVFFIRRAVVDVHVEHQSTVFFWLSA